MSRQEIAAAFGMIVLFMMVVLMLTVAIKGAIEDQKFRQHNCEVRKCRDGRVATYYSGTCVCMEEPPQ